MYPRELTPKILNQLNSRDIIFLLGTRQTGKTTLSHLIAEQSLYKQNEIHFIDFEDKENRSLYNQATLSNLKQVFRLEGIDYQHPHLLVFDEVQLLDDPSNLLKLLHDHFPNLKTIATGSSSLQIKTKFSDSLAGRKRVYHVQPLSFDEFLLFREEKKLLAMRKMFYEENNVESLTSIVDAGHHQFLGLFEEYLIYGGYPEVVLIPDQESKLEKLDSIVSSYIQKDIREVANIENLSAYNNLLKYLAINAGAQFNLSSAALSLGISSITLKKFLNLLKETFIIDELPPFFTNRNKEISKSQKHYFKDSGVNNLFLKNFNRMDIRPDAGALYETYVFNNLLRNKGIASSLYFYRTQSKSEIDFIFVENANHYLIEVKSGKNYRIPRPMIEFEKRYHKHLSIIKKQVINQSVLSLKSNVQFVPAYLT